MRHVFLLSAVALTSLLVLSSCSQPPAGPPARQVEALIGAESLHYALDVSQFYTANQGAPVWTGADNRANLMALISAVRNSSAHGLIPDHYHPSILEGAFVEANSTDTSSTLTDAFLTDVYFTLAHHLRYGKVDPLTIESTWSISRPAFNAPAYLQSALAEARISESLEALAPEHEEYLRLQEGLAYYSGAGAEGGWSSINGGAPLNEALRPGDQGAHVAELRARLEATGDLTTRHAPSDPQLNDLYTEDLEVAVRRFQRRAALPADGIVGAETLERLNQSPAERVDQIRATLERWRWIPTDLGARHIRVNIASFQLEAWEDGTRIRTHGAIVGRTYRRTPVFSADLQYLIVNPWWETPYSIAVRDKLPQFRSDPDVIPAMGYEIRDAEDQIVDSAGIDWDNVSASQFPYRIRQAPGPLNALGQIKFIFPNQHNVYIHDTPSRNLFAEGRRDFSSGCIRIENPLELADWVLNGAQNWSPKELRTVTESGAETRIDLNRSIPVHILYFTTLVDNQGRLQFLDDIYQRDAAVLAALNAAPGEGAVSGQNVRPGQIGPEGQ